MPAPKHLCVSCTLLLCLTARVAQSREAAPDQNGLLEEIACTDKDGMPRELQGRVLAEALDGGLLIEDRAGVLWNITPDRLKSRQATQKTFSPYSPDELAGQVRQELGDGFLQVRTPHYLIFSKTSRAYTEWCGQLFERFLAGFGRYWQRADLDVPAPDRPLVVLIFPTRKEFLDFYEQDVGQRVESSFGYFSVRRNRIVLYDLTESVAGTEGTPEGIRRAVAKAPLNVATVIHEATHQIAFNTGLHTRYADNPMWVTEGLAMFFEPPDLSRGSGWRTAGRTNEWRLRQFREAQSRLEAVPLESLIGEDDRFREAGTAADAYTHSWALTYFLVRTKRKEYTRYLQLLAAKTPLVWDKPPRRLAEFQECFGDDLEKLNKQFHAFMKRQRA